jgi:multisubunit Na+/H+ antiporter MnhG subunit
LIELASYCSFFAAHFSSIDEISLDFIFVLLRPTFKSAVGTASDKSDIKKKTLHQPKSAQRDRLFQSAAF